MTVIFNVDDSLISKILDYLITTFCEYIIEEVPKNETKRPVIHEFCEFYLGLNDERTVQLVEVSSDVDIQNCHKLQFIVQNALRLENFEYMALSNHLHHFNQISLSC